MAGQSRQSDFYFSGDSQTILAARIARLWGGKGAQVLLATRIGPITDDVTSMAAPNYDQLPSSLRRRLSVELTLPALVLLLVLLVGLDFWQLYEGAASVMTRPPAGGVGIRQIGLADAPPPAAPPEKAVDAGGAGLQQSNVAPHSRTTNKPL